MEQKTISGHSNPPDTRQSKNKFRDRTSTILCGALITALPIILSLTTPAPEPVSIQSSTTIIDEASDKTQITSYRGGYLAARTAAWRGNYERAEQLYQELIPIAEREGVENRYAATGAMRMLLRNGKIDEAVTLIEKYGLDKYTDTARLTLVSYNFKQGKILEALAANNKISKSGIGTFIVPLNKAWLMSSQGNYGSAIKTLESMENNRTTETLALFHCALISELMGRNPAALEYYKKALHNEESKSQRIMEAYGALLEKTDRSGEAAKLYHLFVDESGNWLAEESLRKMRQNQTAQDSRITASAGLAEVLMNFASLVYDEDAAEDGHILLNLSLYLNPAFNNAMFMKALFLESENNPQQAIAVYEGIGKNSIFHARAQQQIAGILSLEGKQDAALARLNRLTAKRPDHIDAYMQKGDILRSAKKFTAATAEYTKAINIAENNLKSHQWRLFFNRAISLEQEGDIKASEVDLNKALSLSPDQPEVLNYLAYGWIENGKNLRLALEKLEKAYAQKPYDANILDSYAWALFKNGFYHEAVENLEKALSLSPLDPFIHDHLGDAYWKAGRPTEARYQWSKALQTSTDKKLANNIEKKIKQGLPGDILPTLNAKSVSAN